MLNYIYFLQCSVADSTPDIFHRSRRQCGLATQENDRLLGPAYQLNALLDLREDVNDPTKHTSYKLLSKTQSERMYCSSVENNTYTKIAYWSWENESYLIIGGVRDVNR